MALQTASKPDFGSIVSGMLAWLLIFLGSFYLRWWNEGHAVRTYKALQEGKGTVVSLTVPKIKPVNSGKLVHITGMVESNETLLDISFGVSVEVIKLVWEAMMYQWDEERKTEKENNKNATKYTYIKSWAKQLIKSDGFHRPNGHENPTSMPFNSRYTYAKKVNLRDFILGDSLVKRLPKPSQA